MIGNSSKARPTNHRLKIGLPLMKRGMPTSEIQHTRARLLKGILFKMAVQISILQLVVSRHQDISIPNQVPRQPWRPLDSDFFLFIYLIEQIRQWSTTVYTPCFSLVPTRKTPLLPLYGAKFWPSSWASFFLSHAHKRNFCNCIVRICLILSHSCISRLPRAWWEKTWTTRAQMIQLLLSMNLARMPT